MTAVSRWDPLRVRRFRALWLAGVLSWYGDYLTTPALLVICYRLGGTLGVGLVVFFQVLPMLALLPIGGRLGDVGDRRRRLVALDLVRAGLAGLMVAGATQGVLAAVLIAVAGSRSASALYDPGRRRILPIVLPRRLIAGGSSLLSLGGESAIFIGPALGAVLLLLVSPQVLLLIDGCTFLASAALLSRVGPQPAVIGRVGGPTRQVWLSLRHGFDLLLLDTTTRFYALQACMGAMLAAVATVYFVPLVTRVLHLPAKEVGVMYVIVGGASVLGSLVAVRRPQARPSGLLSLGYLRFAVALGIAATMGPVVMVVALALFAGGGALQEAWGLARIQTTTPQEGMGQAVGAALWFQFLGRAVGAVAGAWAATHLPREEVFLLAVVAAVAISTVAALAGGLRWRRTAANWPPGGPSLPLEP